MILQSHHCNLCSSHGIEAKSIITFIKHTGFGYYKIILDCGHVMNTHNAAYIRELRLAGVRYMKQ